MNSKINLNLDLVCEMSKGRSPTNDFHDYYFSL